MEVPNRYKALTFERAQLFWTAF